MVFSPAEGLAPWNQTPLLFRFHSGPLRNTIYHCQDPHPCTSGAADAGGDGGEAVLQLSSSSFYLFPFKTRFPDSVELKGTKDLSTNF